MCALRVAQVATSDIAFRYLLLDQVRALTAAGHEVTCICGGGSWTDELRARGLTVVTVPMRREAAPSSDFRSLSQLVQAFRRGRFDVVHSHTPKAGILAPVAARIAPVPMVIHTVHGLLTHDAIPFAPRAAFWCVEKFTASLCDLLLFQSREDSTAAVRTRLASPDKVRFLGNGIDTRRFTVASPDTRFSVRQRYGFTPGHVVVGTVGRLVREKGYCEFVAAAKVLTSRYPQLRFLVIAPSDADQNDALPETIFKPLEQIGVLVRLDWTADVEQLYPAFDIFVLPSYREGIPRACVEAAASGCPVIASDIRGCREVVLHGHSGLLVPPRNVAGLIDGLTRLIESPDLRDQMGVRARQLVLCNFDANDMLNRLINYYNEISAALFARAKPVPCATASPVPAAASRGAIANADRTAAEHPVRLAGTRASG